MDIYWSEKESKTKPLERNVKGVDPKYLLEMRYGTGETVDLFGAESAFRLSLFVQSQSVNSISERYPDKIKPEHARMIEEAVERVDYDRIREIEADIRHDVIAINRALAEVTPEEARYAIHMAKTSADTTENVIGLQHRGGLEIIANSVENVRDITLEKAKQWRAIPHMDQSHTYDAVPTTAGRPLVFFAEMLQSDLDFLKHVHDNSTIGKWGDATGNHHSATDLGMNGIVLQRKYCNKLGLGYMDAPAQVVGREFRSDVMYVLARTGATIDNLARYIRWGKSDDVRLFYTMGKKGKGSSTMPHKDIKGGNPIVEEQAGALNNYLLGTLTASVSSIPFNYARDLTDSASNRIIFSGAFKFTDHAVRRMAGTVYYLGIDIDRANERFERTHGVTTSQRIMNALISCEDPLPREQVHDLVAELSDRAYKNGQPFVEVLLEDSVVVDMIGEERVKQLADDKSFIGMSDKIIDDVYRNCHGKKTF